MRLAMLMASVALSAAAGTAFAADDGIGRGPEIFPPGSDCSDLSGAARTECTRQHLAPDDGNRSDEVPQSAADEPDTQTPAAGGAVGTAPEGEVDVTAAAEGQPMQALGAGGATRQATRQQAAVDSDDDDDDLSSEVAESGEDASDAAEDADESVGEAATAAADTVGAACN